MHERMFNSWLHIKYGMVLYRNDIKLVSMESKWYALSQQLEWVNSIIWMSKKWLEKKRAKLLREKEKRSAELKEINSKRQNLEELNIHLMEAKKDESLETLTTDKFLEEATVKLRRAVAKDDFIEVAHMLMKFRWKFRRNKLH